MGLAATIVILAIVLYSYYREESLRKENYDIKETLQQESLKERRRIWEEHRTEVQKLEEKIENLKNSNETKELRDSIISDYDKALRIISDSADKHLILDEIPKLELAFCQDFYHYWQNTYNSPISESEELDISVYNYYQDNYYNYHYDELVERLGLNDEEAVAKWERHGDGTNPAKN